MGRLIAYTDVWGQTTTSAYDQGGRLTDTAGPAGSLHTDYDGQGRVSAQKLFDAGSWKTLASAAYDAGSGLLASVSYPSGVGNGGNGTSGTLTRDARGRMTGLTWNGPGGSPLASDTLTRSAAGRVVDQMIDSVDARPGAGNDNFLYDGAGRLCLRAGHTLTYAFAPTGGCGALTTAGKNSNRTSMSDNGATTTYCYDQADRLTSTTDSRYQGIAYADGHGNTTSIGGTTLAYDGPDRHVQTVTGATTIRYERDAADRIIERTRNGVVVARYGYSGAGDTPDFTMDGNNGVMQQTYSLLGGVLLTKQTTGTCGPTRTCTATSSPPRRPQGSSQPGRCTTIRSDRL